MWLLARVILDAAYLITSPLISTLYIIALHFLEVRIVQIFQRRATTGLSHLDLFPELQADVPRREQGKKIAF